MNWHIGMQLVCIRNDIDEEPDPRLEIGRIYTLDGFYDDWGYVKGGAVRRGQLISVAEIKGKFYHAQNPDWCWLPLYWPEMFRPLQKRKTDISVFTKLLNREPEKV